MSSSPEKRLVEAKKEYIAPARPTPLSKTGNFDPETSGGAISQIDQRTLNTEDQRVGVVMLPRAR